MLSPLEWQSIGDLHRKLCLDDSIFCKEPVGGESIISFPRLTVLRAARQTRRAEIAIAHAVHQTNTVSDLEPSDHRRVLFSRQWDSLVRITAKKTNSQLLCPLPHGRQRVRLSPGLSSLYMRPDLSHTGSQRRF